MVRVGIIGLGDGGMCNLRGLLNAGEKIVALCDTSEARLHEALDKQEAPEGICIYGDHTSLIKNQNIDLVVIATPDNQHLVPAEDALKEGKYVFVEKPLATTILELEVFAELNKQFPGKLLFSEKYSYAYPVLCALQHKRNGSMGEFMTGHTSYTMWRCDRIMGGGKWRTEHAYNPCAGGLSHNFMTALLFTQSPIKRVRATGTVLTYHDNLDQHAGYDTMEGTLEFESGRRMSWQVCLAVQGDDSPYGHRTVTHTFQFRKGCLVYGPRPETDRLIVNGEVTRLTPEPGAAGWASYNSELYTRMHVSDVLNPINGEAGLHHVGHGLNVAAACALAFESTYADGEWKEIPSLLKF